MPKEVAERSTNTKVILVRCDTYEPGTVKNAVSRAIGALGGFEIIFSERVCPERTLPQLTKAHRIVLKPNLLAKAEPDKAVTTHPAVFRAVAELLQEEGYGNLRYGDSPGNPLFNTEKTAETCGIKSVADELKIPAGDFEHGTEVAFPEGRVTEKFVLCDEIARLVTGEETGGIINLCKMKTHQLERITGAVKNTFGCVYGINKAASHAKYATAETFAKMVADLNRLVVPRLHIMDGIVAMEGNGPGSGDPRSMNVILASMDPVALDATFCHLVHLNPDLVPTHGAGMEAGIGQGDEEKITVVAIDMPMIPDGTELTLDEVMVKCGDNRFSVQRSGAYRGQLNMLRPFAGLLEKKPHVLKERCVGCGICIETCPLDEKAIRFGANRRPVYDYGKCIKCYCCQEMCPEKAISVKRSLLSRLADRKWRV